MVTELAGNLIVREGKILLLYREDEEHWEVPGGKVEPEESATEAAQREAREEIGTDVELRQPFYSGEFQHGDEIFLWHCYLATPESTPEVQEEKFGKLEWFEPSDLPENELAPNLRMILPALRNIQ